MKKENTSTRLRKIMSDRKLRQVDILELCKPYCKKYEIKLGRNDLSQYVNGKVEPGQKKLTILGLALNVSEAWLMGYDVPQERTAFSTVDAELLAIDRDLETFDKRIAYYTNFRRTLNILGYSLTTHWREGINGEQIDLLENSNYQIEISHSNVKEIMDATMHFTEFQLKNLFEEYNEKLRDKECNTLFHDDATLNAAHARTDIDIPDETDTSDDDIMSDKNF